MNRICIYPKDISQLTGKGKSYSCNVVKQIKKANNKKKYQPITIEEYCQYFGLKLERIKELLK